MSAHPSDKADDVLVAEGYDSASEDSQDDDTEGEDDQGVLPQHSPRVDKTSWSATGSASERGKLAEACQIEKPVPVHDFECPVCLQIANFPVKLPCSHIFCFLCVKGFANRSKRCALCRQEVPADFFNDPKLICRDEIQEKAKTIYDEGYQWFYEGRHGWWQYDDRTSYELERRFKDDDKAVFELLIAGFLYVIDLENMRQYRRNDHTRKRKIKRDMQNIPDVKGIAGLKFGNQPNRPNGDGQPAQASVAGNSAMPPPPVPGQPGDGILPSVVNDGGPGDDAYLNPPAAPNNTPQTPMTPADSQPGSLSNSTEDLSMHFHSQLHLSDHARAGSSRSSPIVHAGSSRSSPSVEPDVYIDPDEPDEYSDPNDSDTDSEANLMGLETTC